MHPVKQLQINNYKLLGVTVLWYSEINIFLVFFRISIALHDGKIAFFSQ
jgi:hypothetical protein